MRPGGSIVTPLPAPLLSSPPPGIQEVHLGGTVVLGYVDQSRSGLDASKTVYEEISQGLDVLTLGDREVKTQPHSPSPERVFQNKHFPLQTKDSTC
jgi:hypothetical protein